MILECLIDLVIVKPSVKLPLNHLRLGSFLARAPVFPCGGGVAVCALDAGR